MVTEKEGEKEGEREGERESVAQGATHRGKGGTPDPGGSDFKTRGDVRAPARVRTE